MTTLSAFRHFTSVLQEQEQVMSVLFVGHGSPMNGIEDTEFSRRWTQMTKEIPTPLAVLVVSGHWFTKGTKITVMDFPKTIHDFGGFPKELFEVQYPAPGNLIGYSYTRVLSVTDVYLGSKGEQGHFFILQ